MKGLQAIRSHFLDLAKKDILKTQRKATNLKNLIDEYLRKEHILYCLKYKVSVELFDSITYVLRLTDSLGNTILEVYSYED